ncbi:conserved exported hypothetical protein [Rhodococcus sp. RD6.2]|jgi:hypothetical protein|uniref:hypothetical protein n=1 Tax=Rhodococcus sp. RD6.2 TaxID=260936 RepID=UPI00063B1363|nr:hypothetical protein [Rhodococcus sp. RD6.2]CRK54216.1 conserved exported hypothetical protein [Rhodococcus sp. RD6.2]
MKLARRTVPAVVLAAAALAAALTGCSSESADAAASTECVDATLPNATAEEIVDVLRPQPAGEEDETYRQLVAQFDQNRSAEIERVKSSSVFTATPEGGDAAFAAAVCGQARWDAATTPDGVDVPSVRGQRAAIASAGQTFCYTFEQLRPSAESTGAWSDWPGYVEMMTRGDDSADAKQLYSAALENVCPQFA